MGTAYTISGVVGLDNQPSIVALDESINKALSAKQQIEAATPKFGIDPRGAQAGIAAVSKELSTLSATAALTFSQVQDKIDAIKEASRRSAYLGLSEDGSPFASKAATAPVTSALNAARGAIGTNASSIFQPIENAAAKAASATLWNFSSLKASLPPVMVAAQAAAAQAMADQQAADAAKAKQQAIQEAQEKGKAAAAAEEKARIAALPWDQRLANMAKTLRFDDRKMGESALASFFGRGTEGIADMGLSAAGMGGAATVISGTAKALNEVLDKVDAISKKVQETGGNWSDVTLEVGKQLPVLGEVVRLGERIGRDLTGDTAYIEGVNAEMEIFQTHIEATKKISDVVRATTDGFKTQLRDLATEAKAIMAELDKMPQTAALLRLQGNQDKAIKDAESTAKTAKVTAQNAYNVEVERLNELKKKAQEASRPTAWQTIAGMIPGAGAAAMAPPDPRALSAAAERIAEIERTLGMARDKRDDANTDIDNALNDAKAGIAAAAAAEKLRIEASNVADRLQEQWAMAAATEGMGPHQKQAFEAINANRDMDLEREQELNATAIAMDGNIAVAERLKEVTAEQLALEKERHALLEQDAKDSVQAAAEAGAAFGRNQEALDAEVKRLNESAMTEEEKRDAFNKRLGELFDAGLLDDGVYSKLYKDAKPATDEGKDPIKTPALIMAGTAEAFAAKFANLTQDESIELARQQLKATEEAPRSIGREVADALRGVIPDGTDLPGVVY